MFDQRGHKNIHNGAFLSGSTLFANKIPHWARIFA